MLTTGAIGPSFAMASATFAGSPWTTAVYPRRVAPPSGFGWSPAFDVIELAPGVFTATLNPASLRVATVRTLYVDVAAGSDANPGTSSAAPKKSINAALNDWAGTTTIYVKAGTYPEANSWSGGVPFGANVNVIGVTDFAALAPGQVISQASSGVRNGWLNTALSIYVENITFDGGGNGVAAFWAQQAATIAMVNCTFRSGNTEGFAMNSNAAAADHAVYLIGCTFTANAGDGVDYTALGAGSTIRVLEWGCTHASNSGAGTDQGSSAHFTAGNTAVSIIRLGGTFAANKTHGFADVGGTTVWAVGCRFAGESVGAYVGDAGTAWLHGCVFNDCTTDLTANDATSTIRVADSIHRTAAGAGAVSAYLP